MTTLRKLACGLAFGCLLAPLSAAPAAAACNTTLTVNLEEEGDGVTVELRLGVPGKSVVVSSKASSGKRVYFSGLCAGSYFMAIGNQDYVEVTPVHQFQDNMRYESTISLQTGGTNVTHKSRKDL
jgi:hypothetical protein